MPRIVTKVEGKGNGIKTVFPNMFEVATALRRDPNYITKYFGYELGALSQYSEKSHSGVVNGNHSWNTIHDLLKQFITTFVLCHKCGNPETDFGMSGGNLTFHCLACGGVSQGPQAHRLTQAILKDIAVARKAAKKGGRGEKEAAGRRPKKTEHEHSEGHEHEHHEHHEHEEEQQEEEEEEVEWSTDISKDAVETRRLQAIAAMSSRAAQALLGAKTEEVASTSTSPSPAASPAASPAPAATSPSIPLVHPTTPVEAPPNPFDPVVARVFEAGMDAAKIQRGAPMIQPMLGTQMAHLQLLIAIIRYLQDHHIVSQSAALMKAFYDSDLLPEEVLLMWAKSPDSLVPLGADRATAQQVLTASKPLIDWLQTAEEEDEDEEEEEVEKKAVESFIDSL
eukprot:GAFH01001784.1.p1 GENE.GAFH01001784.1~~GAFH01001784.1.p1  ORF type:complete len:437 (+),score=86.43 GAFH01001784.1:128-1312(+)